MTAKTVKGEEMNTRIQDLENSVENLYEHIDDLKDMIASLTDQVLNPTDRINSQKQPVDAVGFGACSTTLKEIKLPNPTEQQILQLLADGVRFSVQHHTVGQISTGSILIINIEEQE